MAFDCNGDQLCDFDGDCMEDFDQKAKYLYSVDSE